MKSRTRALVTIATLLVLASSLLIPPIVSESALASSPWTNTGGSISSYSIPSLAYDSVHNILYAGTSKYGVWKYNGTNWTDTGGGISSFGIPSLAYDSVHNLLYAGTSKNGVWKYNGTNWNDTGGGVANEEIDALAYDSVHNLLYAGTAGQGVWKYSGSSWTGTGGGVASDEIYSLAYDSVHNRLYAGTAVEGVWMYNGASWASTHEEVVSILPIYCLTYDSTHNLLYAGTGEQREDDHPGVLKYDGTTWTQSGAYPSNCDTESLVYDSVHNLLYAGTGAPSEPVGQPGVFKYDGTDWYSFGGDLFNNHALACDSTHNLLYAGTDNGVRRCDTSPSSTFYFAEGTTRPGFDPYFCIQNPSDTDAEVTLTYMKGDGTTVSQDLTVPKSSRATVSPKDKLGTGDDAAHDFSARVACANGPNIIVERSMYFDYKGIWTGGHDVVGATSTSSTFYFAEGTTRPGFDPYFCIQNPGDSPADVTLTYMKGDGTTATDTLTVPKNSRSTVSPKDKLGTGDDPAHDFSTRVECTNGQKIIAERPMYFDYKGIWTGGHDVVGETSPSSTYYFAEGTCRPGFDPYFCIQNPGGAAANVTLTYMKGDGTEATDTLTVPKNSRSTVSPRTRLGTGDDPAHDFSTRVECTNGQKIIAERPMYFDYKGIWTGGHDVVGETSPSSTYYFAEGTCRPNFDPYICIQNPGDTDAAVSITYLKGDGTAETSGVTVAQHSRATVSPRDTLGTGDDPSHDFSAFVWAENYVRSPTPHTYFYEVPIIIERPMYFNYKGTWTGGHDVVGFHY